MISVLIPTANRPEFLRTALRSVQRQTALNRITEVIVSENAGNRASEQVCKDFDRLPIRYVYRDPQTEFLEHFSLLVRDTKNEYAAVLFDDDWWAVNHIENGLRHFTVKSDLSCYYSAYFMVSGEACVLNCHPTLEFWLGSGFRSFENQWKLTLKDTVVACLVDVPCSYSALVAPSEYLKRAWHEVVKSGNKYDSDRTLTLELAQLGAIVVNPVPEIFVRFHSGQDKNRSSQEQVKQFKKASLNYLIDVCKEHQINLGAELDLRLASAPANEAAAVCDAILNNYECVILDKLVESRVLLQYWKDTKQHWKDTKQQPGKRRKREKVGELVKQFLPVVIINCARKILRGTP